MGAAIASPAAPRGKWVHCCGSQSPCVSLGHDRAQPTAPLIGDAMSYYKKVIQPDETLRYVGRLHWIIYLKANFILVIDLLILFAYIDSHEPLLGWLALVLVPVWLFFLIAAWLRHLSTEIIVTDKRVIFKKGLISRETMEMNMSKVETVDVTQSITGRIFDYGDIVIRGSGSTYEPLRRIGNPMKLRGFILAQ
jgi:membrane protein YdbS with pleckstrin-like domain